MPEGVLSVLLCFHNVGIETFGLHGLTLYVFEFVLYVLLCILIAGIESFYLHGQNLCVFEDDVSSQLHNDSVNIYVVCSPY